MIKSRSSIKNPVNRQIPVNTMPRRLTKTRQTAASKRLFTSPQTFEENVTPGIKEKVEINVVGSLIYEEPATGDFSLNFYTAKMKTEVD